MITWNIEEALLRMEVGDSFFVPTLSQNRQRAAIYGAAKRVGVAVIARNTLYDGVLGVRAWRVLPGQTLDSSGDAH